MTVRQDGAEERNRVTQTGIASRKGGGILLSWRSLVRFFLSIQVGFFDVLISLFTACLLSSVFNITNITQ